MPETRSQLIRSSTLPPVLGVPQELVLLHDDRGHLEAGVWTESGAGESGHLEIEEKEVKGLKFATRTSAQYKYELKRV